MTIQFGKPNYSSGATNTKMVFFKLGHDDPKKRVLVIRIAPPIGPLAEKGIWSRYIKQHWGYGVKAVGREGKEYTIPLRFRCIENKDRNGNITQRCPECDAIRVQKDKLAAKKTELAGRSDEEIKAGTQFVASWLKAHNLDCKWHLVAKDQSGTWGFFQCSHAAYRLLKGNEKSPGLIDEVVARGGDPLSPERGIWVRWQRHGENFNDIRDVPSVFKEEVVMDGEKLERIKYDALTQQDLDALEKLPPLDSLEQVLSFDQIRMLVDSGGDDDTVRMVFNMPKKVGPAPTPPTPQVQAQLDAVLDEPQDEVLPAAPPPPPPPATTDEDDEEAQLQAQIAALKAKKAQKAQKTESKPVPPAPPAATPKLQGQLGGLVKKDLSDAEMDEFLKKFS